MTSELLENTEVSNMTSKNAQSYSKSELAWIALGKIRNLCKNTGVISSTKEENAIVTYEMGAQEIEYEIYGKKDYNLKFGYMNDLSCLAYLVRIEPYTTCFIRSNGKLDDPNRMLSNCLTHWQKVLHSTQCNSELIPEWFYLPQIFNNSSYCYFKQDFDKKVVCNVELPEWSNENPFYFCMKYREFMENQKFAKNLNYWIDLVFGKRQQSVEDNNVYYSLVTEEHYDRTPKDEICRESVESICDFFQLPKKLFTNQHKTLGSKDLADEPEEGKSDSKKEIESVNDVTKDDIKISKDDTINCVFLPKTMYSARKLGAEILTGNLKSSDQQFHVAAKCDLIVPTLCIRKYKKERISPSMIQELKFEIDFPKDQCFATNYISQFTVLNKDFMVISRLYTSSFGVINIDQEPMKCKFYSIDWMSTMVTAVHCTKDNKTLITGYLTGSLAIWDIKFKNSNVTDRNSRRIEKTPMIDFEFRTLQSATPQDNSAITWIDANVDSEMFIAITKNNTVTIHSIASGQCLNWIKMTPSSRNVLGVQLSKNGYFVIATTFRDKSDDPKQADNYRIYKTCIQTFGINGEPISKPHICSKVIRGMVMKERSVVIDEDSHRDQSKKILEKLMDDKIFCFDSEKAYIMNCIDFTDYTEIKRNVKKDDESQQSEAKAKFLGLCLNSLKIITRSIDKEIGGNQVQIMHSTFEPRNSKWNEISDKLIM